MSEPHVPAAHFGKALRGYNRLQVNDYVRLVGEQFVSLQQALADADERCRQWEERASELEERLEEYAQREQAISSALVAVEEYRLQVERQAELSHAEAAQTAQQTLAEARTQAERILQEAHQECAEARARARAFCSAEAEQLRQLRAEYDATCRKIRNVLEAHMSLLPPPFTVEEPATAPAALESGPAVYPAPFPKTAEAVQWPAAPDIPRRVVTEDPHGSL
jgi:cell division septum initiation protein DivIVA